MRSLVILSLLGMASAGSCIIDATEAVSDAMDAFLYTWAAMERCGSQGPGEKLQCGIDIASTVKSLNSMINVILHAVEKCEGFHLENSECGLKASKLTEHAAGLAAAAGEVYQKCSQNGENSEHNHFLGTRHESPMVAPVMCTLDMKDTATGIFKATKALMKMKKKCKKSGSKCASNVLQMVASFSMMGEFLAGAVGSCREQETDAHGIKALCAQAINSAVHHAMKASKAGVDMSRKCEDLFEGAEEEDEDDRKLEHEGKHKAKAKAVQVSDGVAHEVPAKKGHPPALHAKKANVLPPATMPPLQHFPAQVPFNPTTRPPVVVEQAGTLGLYGKNDGDAPINFTNVVVVLGALLPVTVLVSFFGGRYYANRHSSPEVAREPFSARELTCDRTPRD